MKIMIINGPNLNLLGIREPDIYGKTTYQELLKKIDNWSKELNIEVSYFQSNHEGELIDFVQQAYFSNYNGIIINAGGYSHTSIALMDALKAVNIPSIEVHISDLSKRESFRQLSYVGQACYMTIMGEGVEGYHKALVELKARG